ncbi:MAG: YfhO family protein [Anaerolineales bacterium]|nr:YfhO family protein [Anaerolineales bacterium]
MFWGTPSLQFIPWWQWSFNTLLSGHLPLWNPLVGMGAPLIANYQSGLFYPPNILFFLFYLLGGISALAWSQALLVTLHLIWSGVGMAVLSRRLGLGKLAQTLSGLAFALSGYLVSRAWFASINTTAAWLPWVFVCVYDLVSQPRKKGSIVKLGLVIGIQLLAGHAQTSWYTLLLAVLWVSFWAWWKEPDGDIEAGGEGGKSKFLRRRLQRVLTSWGWLAAAGLIAAGIAAVQLLPTAAYLFQSQRASEAAYEAAMTYSFWPWRLLGLLAPNIFGNPAHSNYWGYGNFWEDAIYIGLLPILLALGVLVRRLNPFNRRQSSASQQQSAERFQSFRLVNFFGGVISVSLLLALGKNTPVFPWLYKNVPTFDMFQSPTRFSIWMVLALGLLAGIGVENWRRPTGRGLYWTRLGTAGAFAVTLGAGLGGIVLRNIATDFKPTFVPAIAFAGLWALGVGGLALSTPVEGSEEGPKRHIWGLGVVLWVTLDLLVAGWGLNPGIDLDFYQKPPDNLEDIQEMVGDGRLFLLSEDEHTIKYDQYFRFEAFEPEMGWDNLRSIFLPNLNMLDRIPVVNNYDPLVPDRYARWMEEMGEINIHYRDDILDLMAVSTLQWESAAGAYGVRFIPRDVVSRLRWVPCARYVGGETQAWDLVFSGEVDFETQVVIEAEGSDMETGCAPAAFSPQMVSELPNEVLLRTEERDPGWLVLSDVWYLGWKAWVVDEPVPIYRADYLFRGVQVPAGYHEIRFSYRPAWFYAGAVVSLLSLLGLLGLILYGKRKPD